MKNLLKIMLPGIIGLLMLSCATHTAVSPSNVAGILQSGEFTFMAERANPSGNDVINVLNSLPRTSSAQMLNLDPGYNLEIRKNVIKAELPYFGRMYMPTMNQEKNSYRFTSNDFTINKTDGKKGSVIYNIAAKDQQNDTQMILEVYSNGKAYLTVRSNDRQSISYDGYVTSVTGKK
ncbi:DUF4251 domain-containing protein [Kaistella palustris]|uniref:DUF4251 domain-containing protein n=1 Tax=Kaistella palustris TaxID=493376 RepID=UPI0003FB3ECD|nr:DUF4251 domain-containing protein [Kaistella palustris]